MIEVPFHEKNRLVQREANPQHFDADVKTFKSVWPDHPLIPSLENANQYTRKGLHERILYQLCSAKTPEEIIKLRGGQKESPKAKAPKQEQKTGLAAMSWNDLKKLAKELDITTTRKKRVQVEAEVQAKQDKQKKSQSE